MTSCYKTSNNKYFKCPPMMSDGRHFTDYRPNCQVNNSMKDTQNMTSSFQYRQYLTHNAQKLMDINRAYACQKNCCSPCVITDLDEKTIKSCNKNSCTKKIINKNGLGQGRNYNNKLQNRNTIEQPYNCCAKNNDLFNYYNHIDSKIQGEFIPRLSHPSGGNLLGGGDPDAFNM